MADPPSHTWRHSIATVPRNQWDGGIDQDKPSAFEVRRAYLTLRHVFFVRLSNIPSFYNDHIGLKHFRKMGKHARLGGARHN